MWTPTNREWIEAAARAEGFELAGVAPVPASDSEEACAADSYFAEWVESGKCGGMEWLKRRDADGHLVRGNLRRALPWARSVVVCAKNYNSAAPYSTEPAKPGAGWIARYAWSGGEDSPREGAPPGSVLGSVLGAGSGQDIAQGSDYHDLLLPKLKRLEQAVTERFGAATETRAYVDTGPIVERHFAVLAGIGWIGKNTCVLNQVQGSWLLLGVLITSLEILPDAFTSPAADRCGSCTRCLDACPTDALIAPRQMDASRCISYLTIEHKGGIPEPLRAGMGRQVFGCDICQDVCPWNGRAPVSPQDSWPVRPELVNPELAFLAAMDGPEFKRWFKGSPLERTGRKRVQRNVAIAVGNSGDGAFLPQLQAWSLGSDPVLAEAAQWACRRISDLRDGEEHGSDASHLSPRGAPSFTLPETL